MYRLFLLVGEGDLCALYQGCNTPQGGCEPLFTYIGPEIALLSTKGLPYLFLVQVFRGNQCEGLCRLPFSEGTEVFHFSRGFSEMRFGILRRME